MRVYKQITFFYKKSKFSKLDFMMKNRFLGMKIGSRTRPDRPRPRKTWKTGRKPRKPRNNKIDQFLRRPTFSRPTFKETCVSMIFPRHAGIFPKWIRRNCCGSVPKYCGSDPKCYGSVQGVMAPSQVLQILPKVLRVCPKCYGSVPSFFFVRNSHV